MNFYAKIMRMLFSCIIKFLRITALVICRIKKNNARKLIMKINLVIFLLISTFMQISIAAIAQKINLTEKDIPMPQLLEKISKQTGYDFFYTNEMFSGNSRVAVSFKDANLEEVLNYLFKEQNLKYIIKYKTIVVQRKTVVPVREPATILKKLKIKGLITDSKGKEIPGAVIAEKGTQNRTASQVNGTFSIEVNDNATLIISYVGYDTQEIKLKNNQENLTVVLAESLNQLGEIGVISTGYQKIKKDQLTGAASVMTEKEYQQREAVTGNFLESLEGKIPGLVYNSQTDELSIRGVASFDAVKQPLIVVDGFPTEIDLRTINPNDIISVSVLRDAAAASIYGVRASNGVIVVETRRGKSGKSVFTLRSTYAIQDKPDFSYLNYAPANEFVQLQKESFNIAKPSYILFQLGYSKLNPAQQILFSGTRLDLSNPLLTADQIDQKLLALGSYDNLKEYQRLFFQKRQTKNINFDVSGGNDKSTYILGLNYIDEIPIRIRSENKQYNLSMANTFKFSTRFNLDFKTTYTNYKNVSGNTPNYSDFYPYEHLTDDQGNALPVSLDPNRNYYSRPLSRANNNALMALGLYDMLYYPYRELASNTNTSQGSSIRFLGRLNTKLTDWLNMDLGGNYENQNVRADRLQLEDSYAVRALVNTMAVKDPVTGNAMFSNMPKGNILKRSNTSMINYTMRGQLNFAHKFGENNHDFSGILGIEQKITQLKAYTTSYFGYEPQTLINKPINMGILNATTIPAFTSVGYSSNFINTDYFNQLEGERRFRSFYGEGTYIFKNKYIATGSFRIDQSNLFGADPKYKNKPLWSTGLNWRIGEEDFIKQIPWIDNMQVRTATGFNGNVPNSYNGAFLILYSGLNTSLNVPLTYYDVLTPQNQSIRWETTRNYNLGLDYTLLKNRISGSVDWYMKKTRDVFGQFDADPTSGFNQYNANTASIQNKGLEFLVNSVNIKLNNFKWTTQVTASFNSNKVLAIKATEYANSQLITSGITPVLGLPIGALFSYNYGGLNEAGQPYVIDKKGNHKVLAFSGSNRADVTKDDLIYNGTTTPKYVLGLNNQITLGAFDVSFLFMYYGGHVMRVEQPNPNNIGALFNNPLAGSNNFWRKPGDENNTMIPGFLLSSSSMPGYFQSSALYGYQYATQFVRRADYIRLRDIVVTYNAKIPAFEKIGLKNTQLRFQAQNAFRYTFSGNDIDPDAINRNSGTRSLTVQPFYSLTFSTNF
ncbi:hypothetical protein DBR43_27175 [Pedobacter sp. KBW06]|nr:hypothetical protein DBR43_27175 [Pedobacter sp. KBW06]